MDYSGSVTTTISGNTVTVKYSVTAPSNWMKVKVWLNGHEYWIVSSVPWSGTKTLTKTLTISGPATIRCAMGIIHPDTGANVKTIIPNTNLSQTPASYTVAYNANGGTGAPASQTKYYGTAIKLSATKPTRTGYTFSKWNTAANGTGTSYAPGASYTANTAATLYAQWTANKYTVTYDANGGTGAPAAQTKTYGQSITITSAEPTRARYRFLGWAESKSATSVQYSAGGTYSKAITSNVTLYAVWELAYQPPVVSKVTAVRCDADGNDADDGTYARVSAVWSIDTVYDSTNVGTVVGRYAAQGSEDYTEFSMEANGTESGTATAIVPNMSADVQYLITVTASDAVEIGGVKYTGERSAVLTKAAFVLDFHAGGRGIGIGCAAPSDGFDFGCDARFFKKIKVGNESSDSICQEISSKGLCSKQSTVDSSALSRDATVYNVYVCSSDKNGYLTSYLQSVANANGNIEFHIASRCRNADNTDNVTNAIYLMSNPNGTKSVGITDPSAWRNALGASIMVKCASKFTISTTLTKVNMDAVSEIDTTGKLSISNGGVKCEDAGWVRVTARYRASNITSKAITEAKIYRNSSEVIAKGYGFNYHTSAWYANGMIDGIVRVSAGDIIYFYINTTSGSGTLYADSGDSMVVTYI